MEFLEIKSVTYMDFIQKVPSFISLDISKNSTGWVKWVNNTLTHGTHHIEEQPDSMDDSEYLLKVRKDFRKFLRNLFGDEHYEYVFVEDIIGGVNFKTNRVLFQLNPIVDDMVDDGIINANSIFRENNGVWKKNLKECSNFNPKIRAQKNDKLIVMECLFLLGFGDNTTNHIAEDIYDAMGMAVGTIYRRFVKGEKTTGKRLRKDVSKVYTIEQFEDLFEALDRGNELDREILEVDFTHIKKDLKYNFKRLIEDLDDDTKIYVITIPTAKIGAIALDKNLDLDMEMSHLVIYRKKI